MKRPELGAGPPREGSLFRAALGLIALLGGLGAVIMLTFHEVPEGNRDALFLAIGLVLQWGGSVIASEFGSSPAGRQMVDISARKLEEKS